MSAKLAPIARKHNYASSQLSQNLLFAKVATDGEVGFVGPADRIDSIEAVDCFSVAVVMATFVGRFTACLQYLRDLAIPGCH